MKTKRIKTSLYFDVEIYKEIKIWAIMHNITISKIIQEYFEEILEIKNKKNMKKEEE